jgi:beta-lactamase superfamily II metal-dependent hydrolase
MPRHTVHFLNVKNGDCSIIEHGSGHVSVIDVCNSRSEANRREMSFTELVALELSSSALAEATGSRKNYGQKKYPENPIEYLQRVGISSVFRFALTHPDMDHMDGIKDFFEVLKPGNFYDTDNTKEMTGGWDQSPYREEDWLFYKNLRDSKPETDPKRITLFSGDNGIHRSRNWEGEPPGDAFYTLAPTPALVQEANEEGDEYNDASYVFMYRGAAGRVIFSGDSHDATWEHILAQHGEDVADVELLIAPHHGRKSGRSYDFLETVNPALTLFGNAPAKDLAYDAWRNRGLDFITNNQAGTVVVDCREPRLTVYVSNEEFARDRNAGTTYSTEYQGWLLGDIVR